MTGLEVTAAAAVHAVVLVAPCVAVAIVPALAVARALLRGGALEDSDR